MPIPICTTRRASAQPVTPGPATVPPRSAQDGRAATTGLPSGAPPRPASLAETARCAATWSAEDTPAPTVGSTSSNASSGSPTGGAGPTPWGPPVLSPSLLRPPSWGAQVLRDPIRRGLDIRRRRTTCRGTGPATTLSRCPSKVSLISSTERLVASGRAGITNATSRPAGKFSSSADRR